MISLVILHIKILDKVIEKLLIYEILHFISAYFNMKCKISLIFIFGNSTLTYFTA